MKVDADEKELLESVESGEWDSSRMTGAAGIRMADSSSAIRRARRRWSVAPTGRILGRGPLRVCHANVRSVPVEE